MRTLRTAVVLCLAAAGSSCSDRTPPPSTGAFQPVAAVAPGPRLYVSDETGGSVIVIDPAAGTVLERVAVGKRPRGIRSSPDGGQLLVALSGSPIAGPGVDESKLPPPDRAADGIGIIDLAARKLIRTLKSGQDPEAFDLSADGATLYASNEDAAEASIVDVASGETRARVKVGEEPEGVTMRPGGLEVYVTCEGDNAVFVIDTSARKVVAQLKTGLRPRAVAFTRDGAVAFVTNENDASVAVIDAARHRLATTIKIPKAEGATIPPRPMGAVLSPDGSQLYVSLGRAKSVAVIDVAGRKLLRTFGDVGDRPWGIAISSDGRTLYTANGPSGDVSVIDAASGSVTRRVATGGSPWGVVYAER